MNAQKPLYFGIECGSSEEQKQNESRSQIIALNEHKSEYMCTFDALNTDSEYVIKVVVFESIEPWQIRRMDFETVMLDFETLTYPLPNISEAKIVSVTNNSVKV